MIRAFLAVTTMVLLAQAAYAQVPPQADAGRVSGGFQNQLLFDRYMPWWGRPITEADVMPYESEEPVIQFLNMDVQGSLAPQVPEEKLKEKAKP